MLTNPLEFVIKGILPGAPSLMDPATAQAIYPNVALQAFVKVCVFGAFALPVVLQPRVSLALLLRAPFLCAFVLYVLCSTRWSETPANSMNDVIYLVTATCAGTAMAVLYNTRDIARIVAYAGLIIALMSLVMIVLFPAYGQHQASENFQGNLAGDWRGVYTSKNILGQVAATFFLIYIVNGKKLFGSRAFQVGAVAITFLLLLKSHSASALFIVVVGATAYGFIFMVGSLVRLVLVVLSPVFLLVLSAVGGSILSAVGRGSDLSGRSDIWTAAGRVFWDRPLYGYGYGSSTMGGLTAYIMSRFKAQNTHNGYIDLALSSGIIGSLLFYSAIGMALYRCARAWRPADDSAVLIQTLVIFLVGWATSAFSEVTLRPNTAMGAMGIAMTVVLSSLLPVRGVSRDHVWQRRSSG